MNLLTPFLVALLTYLLSFGISQAEENRLSVQLHNIRDTQGHLRVLLYADPAGFPKEDKALKILTLPAQSGTVQCQFEGLPTGRYAIMAYHDENDDQKLNRRFGMFPTEGYGLSNNPKVMGPPRFDESAFPVSATANSVNISFSY